MPGKHRLREIQCRAQGYDLALIECLLSNTEFGFGLPAFSILPRRALRTSWTRIHTDRSEEHFLIFIPICVHLCLSVVNSSLLLANGLHVVLLLQRHILCAFRRRSDRYLII